MRIAGGPGGGGRISGPGGGGPAPAASVPRPARLDSPTRNHSLGGVKTQGTAHIWTTCRYTVEVGTTGQSLPTLTGNSGAIVRRLDHPVHHWFAPLAAGDSGIKALTQMQCSAPVATGVINFVIGHPLAFVPIPVVILVSVTDGIYGAFSLPRIFDDAALAFLEVAKPATTAATCTGGLRAV